MIVVPETAISRLCNLHKILLVANLQGEKFLTSAELGKRLGIEAATIRKDISHLGEAPRSSAGYNINDLIDRISNSLGFKKNIATCVIGLGHWGAMILQNKFFTDPSIKIVAGFDSNLNKLETLKTDIPLFPLYELEEVIKSKSIEFAIVSIQPEFLQKTVEALIKAGIKGMINFSGVILPREIEGGFIVRNIDLESELKILSSLIKQNNL